jgi:hypothetical protein
MKTLTSRVTPAHQDWLDNCAFISRHDTLARSAAATILTQEYENVVPPAQAPPERVIIPLIDRALEPIAKSLPPAKKIRQLPDPLLAELHSFRQLSSGFLCPETSLDTLPEYILFSLIAVLAVAWPILAMLGVMARS